MREKLVAGNWKMHGSLSENKALLDAIIPQLADLSRASCAVCVPFPYLFQAQAALQSGNISLGAQNMSQHEKGAFTGEVSASMLLDFGCKYVIVGHSERRALYGEDDATVAAKFVAAQKAGLTPILCVGETLEEREANITEQVVARQLDAVLAVAGVAGLAKSIVAYEPVWAIGTGKTASPEQAQAVHAFIRGKISAASAEIAAGLVIQYGGSVKAANAAQLFSMPDIDGGLIGGAALSADEFVAICRAAQQG
ncbi:MAG: triose-phosphate isomerase [Pseudomonadota bacterium]|jgi:triosephosphate isomerase|nr:triose-phosphate isomerase [Gammaproteobacteria bacterium]MBU1731646.1 triose-phosphate isomerase [Gammaproteobacteria bacterium]MBU1892668.1 triose-phosphate isomerase [Gammaproteobacteria bacterium]